MVIFTRGIFEGMPHTLFCLIIKEQQQQEKKKRGEPS
jgi:hypothetical protein